VKQVLEREKKQIVFEMRQGILLSLSLRRRKKEKGG